jgi:hypothetical protein
MPRTAAAESRAVDPEIPHTSIQPSALKGTSRVLRAQALDRLIGTGDRPMPGIIA